MMRAWIIALWLLAACAPPPEARDAVGTAPDVEFCRLANNPLAADDWLTTSGPDLQRMSNGYIWYSREYPQCFDDTARDALVLGASQTQATGTALRTCRPVLDLVRYYIAESNRIARAQGEQNWDAEERAAADNLTQLESLGSDRVSDLALCYGAGLLHAG